MLPRKLERCNDKKRESSNGASATKTFLHKARTPTPPQITYLYYYFLKTLHFCLDHCTKRLTRTFLKTVCPHCRMNFTNCKLIRKMDLHPIRHLTTEWGKRHKTTNLGRLGRVGFWNLFYFSLWKQPLCLQYIFSPGHWIFLSLFTFLNM